MMGEGSEGEGKEACEGKRQEEEHGTAVLLFLSAVPCDSMVAVSFRLTAVVPLAVACRMREDEGRDKAQDASVAWHSWLLGECVGVWPAKRTGGRQGAGQGTAGGPFACRYCAQLGAKDGVAATRLITTFTASAPAPCG